MYSRVVAIKPLPVLTSGVLANLLASAQCADRVVPVNNRIF